MFHYITGQLTSHGAELYITNDLIGVQVLYTGTQTQGSRFLHPSIDDHAKTVRYYAFDSIDSKSLFATLTKISGVGPKAGMLLLWLGAEKIMQAVQDFDESILTSISGIGPKLAKKILIEMKGTLSDSDLIKIQADDKLVKNIITMMTSMGYQRADVIQALQRYPDPITKPNLSIIAARLVKEVG
jgi:holliday junction DNA helicase RuvA